MFPPRRGRWSPAVAAAAMLFMPGSGVGQAEPPWPMAGRDARHSGSLEAPEPPYRTAWDRTVGAGGPVAGPTVAADAVVVVASRAVVALAAESGDVLWTRDRSAGPAGAPAIGDQLLYHASGQGPAAALVARRLDDGREVWRTFTGSSVSGAPMVDGGTVYVGTTDGVLLALSAGSGRERWRFEAAGPLRGPPAAAAGLVLASAQNFRSGTVTVHGVDATDGEERWRFGSQRAAPATAVAATEQAAFFGLSDGRIVGIDLEDGNLRWEAAARDVFAPGSVPAAGASIAIADRLHLYLLDPATGVERWVYRLADLHLVDGGRANTLASSSPAIAGDAALIADAAGLLSAVDVRSGTRIWKLDVSPAPVSAAALAPAGIYVASLGSEGSVVALEPDPSGSLVSEVSPTVLFPVRSLVNFVLSSLLIGGLLLLLFRMVPGWRGTARGTGTRDMPQGNPQA